MPKLSLITATHNAEEHLREALDCLIEQTEDDFEVILLDCESTDSTVAIIDEFCNEYVGFHRVDFPSDNIYAAMNRGLELAKGEYVWFYAPDGRITEQTVAAFLDTALQSEADAVCGRLWHFGDFEPYYDPYADTVAVLPRFDKYERSILWDNELSNKIFRRHSLTAKKLTLSETFCDAPALFNLKACLSGMKISGCAQAIYQRREQRGLTGFSPNLAPTEENARGFVATMQEIIAIIELEIRKDTGTLDGDEAFLQEALYRVVAVLIDRFYRRFWHLSENTLAFVRDTIKAYLPRLISERVKKLKDQNPDLALPNMLENIQEAVDTPAFSMLLDISNEEEFTPLINSLYLQNFPFFELFVRQSQFDSPLFPQQWKSAPNLYVLPDANFHSSARKQAHSRISINMRDGKPIDPRVLQKVHYAAVPLFLKPLIFSQTKNSFNVKRSLKERGIPIG